MKKFIYCIAFLLPAAAVSTLKAQNIYTLAGNSNTPGYNGDNIAATAATLNDPAGVAVDAAGNVYIADAANGRIRKVNTAGIITTVAGSGYTGNNGDGGDATLATIDIPLSVAIDGSGNLYIAGQDYKRIRKVNTAGIITTIAGTGFGGFSGDGGPATAAKISGAEGIATDAAGNVYIVDRDNQRIRKISTSGIITTVAGNGFIGYNGDGVLATSTSLYSPMAVAVDAAGNLYIADYLNNRIRKVNTSGIISTIAGNGNDAFSGDGGLATAAEIRSPTGIAVDAAGNVFFVDGSFRIRKINTAGIINTVAGNGGASHSGDGGPATAAGMNSPFGVAVSNSGNIYIAVRDDNRVRVVGTAPAAITTISNNNLSIQLSPNPNNGSFTIEGLASQNESTCTLTIVNMLGQQVYATSLKATQGKWLHVIHTDIPGGLYLVRINNSEGQRLEVIR